MSDNFLANLIEGFVGSFADTMASQAGQMAGEAAMTQLKQHLASGAPQWDGAAMHMQAFQPVMQDPFAGGTQWLGQLHSVARHHGNGWVPQATAAVGGLDVTGLWLAAHDPSSRIYMRQFGPYLSMVVFENGAPTGFGEGMLEPATGALAAFGEFPAAGVRFLFNLKLMPNWTLQGTMAAVHPSSGFQGETYLGMQRVA